MIPINKIASGTKTLIMMKYDGEHIFKISETLRSGRKKI
jgi:hypothetical protein